MRLTPVPSAELSERSPIASEPMNRELRPR